MDETNQKLIEAPRRSKKFLSLFLILVFLVVLVWVMFYNKNRYNESNAVEPVITLTQEEEEEALSKTDPNAVPVSLSDKELLESLQKVESTNQAIEE